MSKHILIVDDSKTVRNLVAFIMKKEGFKVTMAEDGLDGLEKLYSSEQVDLIISDINMPRMDGFTFIKTVRAGGVPRSSDCGAFHRRPGKRHSAGHTTGRQHVYGQAGPARQDGEKRPHAAGRLNRAGGLLRGERPADCCRIVRLYYTSLSQDLAGSWSPRAIAFFARRREKAQRELAGQENGVYAQRRTAYKKAHP